MRFGFSDFAYFSDRTDKAERQAVLEYLLKNGIKDLRFGLNLIQLPSKFKHGDINYLADDIKYYYSMGFDIHVYFFLSDDAANAGQANCPDVWRHLEMDGIIDNLAEDVSRYIDFFKKEGIGIKSYTLGNEIEWGICGFRIHDRINAAGFTRDDDFEWLKSNIWSVDAAFLKRITEVIREKDKDAKIVLHSDSIGKDSFTYTFFRSLVDEKVDFDMIGLTYNCWTLWDDDLDSFKKVRKVLKELNTLNKPVWMLEYAYPKALIDNGELTENPPMEFYSFDLKGQTAFHTDFIKLCTELGVDMIYFWRGEHQEKYSDISWKTGVLESNRFDTALLNVINACSR